MFLVYRFFVGLLLAYLLVSRDVCKIKKIKVSPFVVYNVEDVMSHGIKSLFPNQKHFTSYSTGVVVRNMYVTSIYDDDDVVVVVVAPAAAAADDDDDDYDNDDDDVARTKQEINSKRTKKKEQQCRVFILTN